MKRVCPANLILLLACLALFAALATPMWVRVHRQHLEDNAFKALHRLDNASDLYLHPAAERLA